MFAQTLTCSHCGWRTVCGSADAAARLRLVGVLRRESNPDDATLAELLPEAAKRMTCPGCKRIGLAVSDAEETTAGSLGDGDDDWQAAVLCERCRKPIPPERLEVFPDSKRCVACQSKAESGEPEEDEPEFCPRCGALVELRVSRGSGLTRYKRFCTGVPACRL